VFERVFAGAAPDDAAFPHAVAFERSALSLPIFTSLTHSEQDYVIGAVRDVVEQSRA
jgi:dTDP-4-amino-4,6-dideoxygalactose transaminase